MADDCEAYLVWVQAERGPSAQIWYHPLSDITDGYWKSRILTSIKLGANETRWHTITELAVKHPCPVKQEV